MRPSRKPLLLLTLALLVAVRLYPQKGTYVPPPLPDPFDVPFPDDPPDIFTDPFDPSTDLPDPFDIPLPPEDPFDDPFNEPLPLPPDPWDIPDPFPDLPSLLPDPFDDIPEPPDVPLPPATTHVSAAPGAATNVVTTLMPFPRRLLFPPDYSGKSAAPSKRVCNSSSASGLAVVETTRNTVAFATTCPWKVVAHVPVGTSPVGVTKTPDGTQALVANSGDGTTSGTVSVISLANLTVTKTIAFPVAAPDGSAIVPNMIRVTPDGSRAYVTSHSCNPGSFVYTIDMTSLAVTGSPIPVGCYPSSIAITPDGSQVWVSQRGDNRADVFDIATGAHVYGFAIGLPTGIAFNPTGTTAYIGEGTSPGNVVVIDTSTYQVTTRIPVGNLPHVVRVTPTGHHVFVTNGLSNSISQISTASNKVIRTINLPNGVQHPLGLAFIQ